MSFIFLQVLGGKYVLRMAIGSTLTEETHVREAWDIIQHNASNLLQK